jgi:prepilin-type N-terminal cleavage/methylation domain-containing protein
MTSTTPRRPDRGFTLVELIIVIAIITLLMTMLVVFISSAVKRGQVAKVQGMVKTLTDGCASYKIDFGHYPPADKGSRSLHHYLGSERLVSVQKGAQGDIKAKKPPIIEFDPSWLKDGGGTSPDAKMRPVPLVDAWEVEVRYVVPGKWNKGSVDIWSAGPNGKDELDQNHPDFDDITSWTKEN